MVTSLSLIELRENLAEDKRKNISATRTAYGKYEVMDGESQQGGRAKRGTKRTNREDRIYLEEQIKEQENFFNGLCAEAVKKDKRADAKAAGRKTPDDY